MKYMGSKNRIAKYILPIILKDRKSYQWYVEPFCGGCNMIDKVTGKRIANDINYYLIEMFKSVVNGWTPPSDVSEFEYKSIQSHKDIYYPYLVGFVGIGCSYSGKFFGGYARGNDNNGNVRNYALESRNNLLRQLQYINNILFTSIDYTKLKLPSKSIIYCDPPYEGTTKYKNKFNHVDFWKWCRDKSKEGHTIFISEYNAPDDFECVWQMEINSSLTKNTGAKKGIEKLFTI